MPPQPTAAERAEAQRQNASLRKAKVSTKEGRVIASANRSEGTPMVKKAKGGFMASKFGKALVKKSADTKGRAMVKKACGGSMKKYASGGLVAGHKAADGVATKGKTKATMVKMAMGGSPTDRAIGRMVAKQNAPAMGGPLSAMGMANRRGMALASTAPAKRGLTLGRKKGGSC